jgi:hypothetical protein
LDKDIPLFFISSEIFFRVFLLKIERMVSRYEPEKFDPSEIHKDCIQIIEKNQWISLFEKFDGYCEKVGLEFSCSFNGGRATVGNITIRISEDVIAQITGLPQT